jgi:hypothetical protein
MGQNRMVAFQQRGPEIPCAGGTAQGPLQIPAGLASGIQRRGENRLVLLSQKVAVG